MSWQPKVTAISETRDLTTITTTTLFGKLREHELEMTKLKEMETIEKKSRSLALKTKTADMESSEESSDEYSDTENLNLLTKRFQTFIKMKGKMKNHQSKRYIKKYDSNSAKFTCFGCGKQCHMKIDYPSLVNKEKTNEKKAHKIGKGRKAYIAWEDNASTSCNSSHEDVKANLCLMAGENLELSSENSSTSFNSANYNSLLHVFHETHEEANILALSNNRMKGLNNWLEGKVKELEDEVLKLKTDFDHLEIIYKASSNFDSSQPVNCEDSEALEKKVNYLITIASNSTTNLNAILGSQNCVFEKADIGYQIGFQGKQRKYNSFFKTNEQKFSSPLTCFYCMRKGHSVRNYEIRKFDMPKGLVRWVPKCITNTCEPKFNKVSMPQT